MRETIQQFMWGYQGHFRWTLGHLAEDALDALGVRAAPESLLIGFKEQGASTWAVCVEPENRGYSPDLFVDVERDADKLMEVHPEKDMFHSLAKVHDAMMLGRLEGCRRDIIKAALEGSGAGTGRTFFVGFPRRVADYRVYPVVSVLRSRWDGYPRLSHDQEDGRIRTIESIQAAVVQEVLRQGSVDLDRLNPPEDMSDWSHRLQPEVARRAVSSFVASLVAVHGSWEGTEFSDAMDSVSAQPYEGRSAFGSLILAKPDHENLEFDLKFAAPVPVRSTRSFRKLLEMTGPGLALVTDGSNLIGLGHTVGAYDPELENLFSVRVLGRGSWELSHLELPLLRLDNGVPRLPEERLSRDRFIDTANRVLGEGADLEALWNQATSAAGQQHGTMIVIHRDALAEAKRLERQATRVEPHKLEPQALASVTAIDGAVLLLPDASCAAVGVILDGLASPEVGDPARGARFNSGVRYHLSMPANTCVVVIVSEDGMINLLPDLPRRVTRAAVESAVVQLELAASDDVDFEIASKRAEHAVALGFYMSAEQCDRVNNAREQVEVARGKSGSAITRVGFEPLIPDAKMDESFFLDE